MILAEKRPIAKTSRARRRKKPARESIAPRMERPAQKYVALDESKHPILVDYNRLPTGSRARQKIQDAIGFPVRGIQGPYVDKIDTELQGGRGEKAEERSWKKLRTVEEREVGVDERESCLRLDVGDPQSRQFETCDDILIEKFIECLAIVCEQNVGRENTAIPCDDDTDDIANAFPAEVARRYSPDFIRHILRHVKLSRQALAATLMYMDRARVLSGSRMAVCNKNVNSLVVFAAVTASRVIDGNVLLGDRLAMICGYKSAAEVDKLFRFCLSMLHGKVLACQQDFVPYQTTLERLTIAS